MRSIEDVAVELFAERPMADVTIEEIALKAGTSIRTLYRHFPTKEEILGRYPQRGAATIVELLLERPPSETPVQALRAAIGGSVDQLDRAEFDRWLAAVLNSTNPARVARSSMSAVEAALTGAVAERAGVKADALWPAMAGALCAAAIDVGYRQWFARRGNVKKHVMAAIDVALQGLESTAPVSAAARSGRR
jgi:AcrR family transcriptional regulator